MSHYTRPKILVSNRVGLSKGLSGVNDVHISVLCCRITDYGGREEGGGGGRSTLH